MFFNLSLCHINLNNKEMENFKIVNRSTKETIFLNTIEIKSFFEINDISNYDIENLTEKKKLRKNKILDALAMLTVVAATYITIVIYIYTYC